MQAKLKSTLIAISISTVSIANPSANANPFIAEKLPQGYKLAANNKVMSDIDLKTMCDKVKKVKDAKCGSGKCGGVKTAKEGKCGAGRCGTDDGSATACEKLWKAEKEQQKKAAPKNSDDGTKPQEEKDSQRA